MVLDAYESNPHESSYINILKEFKVEATCQLLGFKFQYYQNVSDAGATPGSLFRLSAVLLANEVITLKQLVAHLAPSMGDLSKGKNDSCPIVNKQFQSYDM